MAAYSNIINQAPRFMCAYLKRGGGAGVNLPTVGDRPPCRGIRVAKQELAALWLYVLSTELWSTEPQTKHHNVESHCLVSYLH